MKPFIKAFACCFTAILWSCLLYAQPKINRVEYYLDNDPGYGKATAISITPAVNLSNIALNINPNTLAAGVHTLGIRALDANGAWSLDNRWLFAKPYPNDTASAGPAPKITRVEYYLDKDPGYGKATPVSITPAVNLANLTVNIDTASITQGVHIFGIRARDANGGWSLDNRWLFAKPYANDNAGPGAVPNIKQVEYYIDTDPGYGKGTPVAIENVTNIANVSLSANISGLDTGSHTIYIRSKDAKNAWSLDNKLNFAVTGKVASPSITVNSVSKKTLCAGDALSVGFDAKGTFNTGNTFTVQLSNGAGSFTSPTTIGTVTGKVSAVVQCTLPSGLSSGTGYQVRVVSSNPAKTSTVSIAITINAKPAKPIITANGSTVICQGSSVTLTSSTAASYMWSTGAATKSITVNKSGNYAVTVANSSGCTATSDTTAVSYAACANPTGLVASGVTASSATLSWTGVPCATKYNVQYKKSGTTAYTTVVVTGTSTTVTGLAANTTYNWRVQTVCTTPKSGYTNGPDFKTAASLIADNTDFNLKMQGALMAIVYPNPAASNATVRVTGAVKPVTITLTDMAGKTLWKSLNTRDTDIRLPVANLSGGVYMVTVTDGDAIKIIKLVKE